MLGSWLRRAWRAFARDFFGTERPRVGSRRRDRLPRAWHSRQATASAPRTPGLPAWTVTSASTGPAGRRSGRWPLAVAALLVALAGAAGVGLVQAGGTPALVSRVLWVAGGSDSPDEATPTAPPASPAGATATPEAQQSYVVQPGDTLLRIAERYGTTVEALVEANHLEDPELVTIGTRLIIPAPPP